MPVELWEAAAKAGETSFENVPYWERAIVDLGVGGKRSGSSSFQLVSTPTPDNFEIIFQVTR
ncbi:hypothetical protein [Mesorhizobium sp.]|uniref:hypothetical protein n=1 Tax=Mesorhizobium sp. TaxID=1871066 RepID=UPI000FE7362C|nr:hypothetical protein [Mesorhizobium sp.]RWP02671.1 MAG: hypothetical protein EOQ99_22465 [Mesorhizobium sp.]